MKHILASAVFGLAALAIPATAGEYEMQIEARQGIMAYRALQLGVLGGMAKGEVAYDAAAAQKAADNLLASVTLDASMLWPEGSDSDSDPESEALPALWTDGKVGEFGAAMGEAATAMQAAAGKDLDSLKAAMGPVGEACGGCHKAYRKPE